MEIEFEERSDVLVQGLPAHAMAVHEHMGKLVVVRRTHGDSCTDDTLEQFNVLPGWIAVREKIITLTNGAIESVCFIGDYIVTAHLNGSIVILHPHSDTQKRVQVCPAPFWAICRIDDSRAALVSNSAVLYTVSVPEGLVQSSLNIGVDQRLFSVAANSAGVLAVGATDNVTIVKNSAVAFSLSVARKERRLPTIVWALCFTARDNIVASGDSSGNVSFWNTDNGALIKVLNTHQADVLSLCLSSGLLWAAGVDPRIMGIRELSPNDFQVVQKRNGPVRDVKALVSCDDKVYAAGDDHEIYVGKGGCQVVSRQWNKDLLLGGGLALCKGVNYVDLYTAGEGEQGVNSSNDIVVARQPVFLARIFTPNKTPLIAYDINSEGTMLALSTSESTTAYQITLKSKKKPIMRLPLQARSATAVKICKNSLLLCCGDFELLNVPLTGGDSNLVLEQSGCGMISQLALSTCEKYAAVISTRSQVFAIDVEKGESRVVRVDLPIDITFTDGDSLFVLCAAAGFDESIPASKKILFEYPRSGGAVRRSISAASLFSRPSARPVSISPGSGDRLLILAADGQWVIINKARDDASCGPTASSSSKNSCTVQFRSANRLMSCRIDSEPETAPFKIKKFGHQ